MPLFSVICALFASLISRIPRSVSKVPEGVSLCLSKRQLKRSFAKSSNAISGFVAPGKESGSESCRWTTSNGLIKQSSALRAGKSIGSLPPGYITRRDEHHGDGSLSRCNCVGHEHCT